MEYKDLDRILPLLKFEEQNEIPIRIKITDKDVCLYVGPRDWQWDRETGKFIGAGTCLI